MENNKVLLVEDDTPTIDIYKTVFDFSGFEIEVADLGEKAINIIKRIEEKKEKAPDIILLDLILPDMTGIDVLKEIKKNENTKNIPIFVFSNYTDNEIENLPKEIRPDKVMLKTDFSPREVVEIVKKKINNKN